MAGGPFDEQMGSRFVSRLPCRERYQHYLHGEQNKRRTPQPATAMRMANLLGFLA